MSWYYLRIAPKADLAAAFSRGEPVLASPSWRRLDLVANPSLIVNLDRYARELLHGEVLASGIVGEGTCVGVLEYVQRAYDDAGFSAEGARITEALVRDYALDDELAVDFYEPAIHPGAEFGWTQPYD